MQDNSIQVTGYIVEDLGVQGALFNVPWATVTIIVVTSYVASLLDNGISCMAGVAASLPAEGLRYE